MHEIIPESLKLYKLISSLSSPVSTSTLEFPEVPSFPAKGSLSGTSSSTATITTAGGSHTFNNLTQGTYTITIQDANFESSPSGCDVTTGSYNWKYMYAINNAGWVTHANSSSADHIEYISAGGGNANHYNGVFEIFNPNTTENTTYQYQGNRETSQFLISAGGFSGNTQFTGISFFNSSGTISGEIQIYGYGK